MNFRGVVAAAAIAASGVTAISTVAKADVLIDFNDIHEENTEAHFALRQIYVSNDMLFSTDAPFIFFWFKPDTRSIDPLGASVQGDPMHMKLTSNGSFTLKQFKAGVAGANRANTPMTGYIDVLFTYYDKHEEVKRYSLSNSSDNLISVDQSDLFQVDFLRGFAKFSPDTCSWCTNFNGSAGPLTLDDIVVADQLFIEPVPEPATWAMMVLGFGAIGAGARRARQQRQPALR